MYSSFIPHPTFTCQPFFSPFIWLNVTDVTMESHARASILICLFMYACASESHAWNERDTTSRKNILHCCYCLRLSVTLDCIYMKGWRVTWTRSKQSSIRRRPNRVTRHGDKTAGECAKRVTSCWRIILQKIFTLYVIESLRDVNSMEMLRVSEVWVCLMLMSYKYIKTIRTVKR